MAMLGYCAREIRACRIGDRGSTACYPDDEGGEGEGGDAERPATFFVEGDGVHVEEEVENTINERHIRCHESEDGFLNNHLEGADEVDCEEAMSVEGVFVSRGM